VGSGAYPVTARARWRAGGWAWRVAAAPLGRRAHREVVFCLVSAPLGVGGCAVTVALLVPGGVITVSVAGTVVGLLLLTLVLRSARGAAGLHLALAARLAGERIAPLPAFRPGHGLLGRLDARLRDGPGWRAVSYLLLKLPVAALEAFAAYLAAAGLADLSYPLWWPLFRNHPPGTRLGPVWALNPFVAGTDPVLHVTAYPGALTAGALGAAAVLAAPWAARAVTTLDRWLARGLLGPPPLEARVRQLEETRARAVDDSAARLRRVERDLHDGAQVRLAALAMSLGMATEKLGGPGPPADLDTARDLVGSAHRAAKEALAELRDLVKGIHPPVLDAGLPDALATLAASSPLPVRLAASLPARPTPAIEAIAYFCVSELLANATKHSGASQVVLSVTSHAAGPRPALRLAVTDDGCGGADPARGSGLAGLAQRVAVVDGSLEIASPPGGPTRVAVDLPLRA
jgi:signal transduction histidine kinase